MRRHAVRAKNGRIGSDSKNSKVCFTTDRKYSSTTVVAQGRWALPLGGTDMPTIEVQRQLLPILDSPNQGARFYNPDLPSTEPFVPGHRTCAGCGPSIQYRMTSKASGDNTILVGTTGCMYVANSSYLCTPYNVPWAHTQIGSAGSCTPGSAAASESMIRKGKRKGACPNLNREAG